VTFVQLLRLAICGFVYGRLKSEMKNVVFWDIKTRSYLTGNTLRLCYIAQPVNAM
jgi:hypothetical protein